MEYTLGSLLKRYGFFGALRLGRDLLMSRLLFSGVRLIRSPWYIRGAQHIVFGADFTAGVGLRADAFGEGDHQIVIGNQVQMGDYVHLAAVESVIIGDHVLMASRIFISDHDHGCYCGSGEGVTRPDELQSERELQAAPVKIGNNVWIGENVCILKGVEIGKNSIIGASSVVTRSIPENSIVAGNPARILKRYDETSASWIKYRQ